MNRSPGNARTDRTRLDMLLAAALAATIAGASAAGVGAAGPPEASARSVRAYHTARLASGFTGLWYEIRDEQAGVVKYGGGFSTYPQQVAPMAIYVPSQRKTFFALSLDEGDGMLAHAISYFDHRTGLVARPRIWMEKKTGDAHDAPAIAFDSRGRLLLFSNTHGENRRASIFRSVRPYDIDHFEEVLDSADPVDYRDFGSMEAGKPVLRFSYGDPWRLADGTLLFIHTRYTHLDDVVAGERDLWWTTSRTGDHWAAPQRLAHIEKGQYAVSWASPGGKKVGIAFNYHPAGHPGAPLDWRTDLFYLETRDGKVWRNAQGAALVSPGHWLTRPDNPARVYDAPGDQRVYLKDVNFTPRGDPVILFLTSPTHLPTPGPRQLRIACFTGGKWVIRDILQTDHDYDHGSLYIEGDVWTVVGAFLQGPQRDATGGRIGIWRSTDQGRHWREVRRLDHAGPRNDTYVRRPLNADPQFWAFWADGDAEKKSGVDIFFADRAGKRFRLPRVFAPGEMFARPEAMTAAE